MITLLLLFLTKVVTAICEILRCRPCKCGEVAFIYLQWVIQFRLW